MAAQEASAEGSLLTRYHEKLWEIISKRTGEIWYRGQRDAQWPLQSGAIQRINAVGSGTPEEVMEYHRKLLETAKLMGWNREAGGGRLKDLELLAVLQHHGAATCLLDFTASFNVAMWFACQEGSERDMRGLTRPAGFSRDDYETAKAQFQAPLNQLMQSSFSLEDAIIETERELKKRFPDGIHELFKHWLLNESGFMPVAGKRGKNGRIFIVPISSQYQPEVFRRVRADEIDKKIDYFLDPERQQRQSPPQPVERQGKELRLIAEEGNRFWIWEPEAFLGRMLSQSSRFLFGPFDISQNRHLYEVMEIEADHKEVLLDELEQQEGLKPKTIFSDIHGFASVNSRGTRPGLKQYKDHMEEAGRKLQEGELEHAIEILDNVIAYSGGKADALICRGLAKAGLNRHREAIQDFDKVIETHPDHSWAYCARGWAKGKLEQDEDAIPDLDMAIKLDPDNALAHGYRGITKVLLRRFCQSIPDLDMAIEFDPNNASLHFARGMANHELARHGEAIRDLDAAIGLGQQTAFNFSLRGSSKAAMQCYAEAIRDYDEALAREPNDSHTLTNRGHAKANLKQNEQAVLDYDKAIELDPNNAGAWHFRGLAKAILEQREEALRDFDKAIELDGNVAVFFLNRGLAKSKGKQFREAFVDFSQAITLEPDNGEAWYRRGTARAQLNQDLEAIGDFDRAVELAPEDAVVLIDRGVAKANLGKLQEALEDFDKAVALDEKNGFAWYNRGRAKAELQELEEASDDMDRAIELGFVHTDAFVHRGAVKVSLEQYAEAISDFDRVIALAPEDARAWHSRGHAKTRLGKIEDGCSDLRQALHLFQEQNSREGQGMVRKALQELEHPRGNGDNVS